MFVSDASNANGNISSDIRGVINVMMLMRLVMFGPYSSRSNEVRIVVTLLVLVMSVSPITSVRSMTLFS